MNNSHDLYVAQGSLFRKYSNSELFARLFDEVISEGRELDHSCEDREFVDVDVHPNFRTLMEHKAFLSTWCTTLMHTREKEVFFFLNALKISLAPTFQEGSFQVLIVETQHVASREGPFYVMFVRTPMVFESQDATKITSALADSFIYLFTKVMRLYMCMVVHCFILRFSQCCDNADIKAHWCLQSELFVSGTIS